MRARMAAGASVNRTPLFDLKHDPGGMVDIEFAVQYLVLAHAHAHPELTRNAGNIALLQIAADVGLAARRRWRTKPPTPIANTGGCSTRCA